MAFAIRDIRSQLEFGGARPALFNINITNPINNSGDTKLGFMARAGQIPASTLGTVEVGYFGRKIKIAGDRTFAEWTVTVVNDEDFRIRNAMEQWMSAINLHESNTRLINSSPSTYKSQGDVQQFEKPDTPFVTISLLASGQLRSALLILIGTLQIQLKSSPLHSNTIIGPLVV